MHNIVKMCVASASELIQHSDLYMTVKAVLFTTPSANLNGVRCTEAFIDNIVTNQDAYVGLPLNADIRSLESGQYSKLGHMFDQKTGEFATAMIGSFYKFSKEQLFNGETALIGYARIMKRNKAVCNAIGELFAEGNLKFSFEISCGEYTELEDGTLMIDAADTNYLEGMCIVWSPACPAAVARELVAELNNDGKEADTHMDKQNETAEAAIEVKAEVENAEVENAEVEKAEAETAEENKAEPEVAEVKDEKSEGDDEEKESEPDTDEKEEVSAEKQCEEPEEHEAENAECEKKEEATAEIEIAEKESKDEDAALEMIKAEIAELKKTIAEFSGIVRQMNEKSEEKNEAEEGKTVVAEVGSDSNPFMAEISLPETKYSLLEKITTELNSYSLLEKAE